MRLSNAQAVARPAIWDRNPVPQVASYGIISVAPHATTQRWIYTVPAGKKFQLGSCHAAVSRDAAPAPASTAASYVQYRKGGLTATILTAALFDSATVGTTAHAPMPTSLVMQPTDDISGQTLDGSTGGACTFVVAMAGTEGDA